MSAKLFLCGDVMLGRGIDQVMPHPGDPQLFEPYVQDARAYVQLSRIKYGFIPKLSQFESVWGDALHELEREKPDLRIINLETALTVSNDFGPGKQIHYRMNPQNVPCLTAARIDCCTLANNHTLDWGYEGLAETLQTLDAVNIKCAGAGLNTEQAQAPAVLQVPDGKGRVLVFAFGSTTSGIPWDWAAGKDRPGLNVLEDLSTDTAAAIAERIAGFKAADDIAVASIHWGDNWGYDVPQEQARFARQLIDGGVDIVHGHSAHHFKAIELYRGRPILYGCGDFINDYEGISGHEEYRGDLTFMYFVSLEPDGKCTEVRLVPMQIKHFRLNYACKEDARWSFEAMRRESAHFGTVLDLADESIRVVLS